MPDARSATPATTALAILSEIVQEISTGLLGGRFEGGSSEEADPVEKAAVSPGFSIVEANSWKQATGLPQPG